MTANRKFQRGDRLLFAVGAATGLLAVALLGTGRADLASVSIALAIALSAGVKAWRARPERPDADRSRRLGWKAWFVVTALFTLWSWAVAVVEAKPMSTAELIDAPASAAALAGLFGYAFDRRFGTSPLWFAVAAVAACVTVGEVALLLQDDGVPLLSRTLVSTLVAGFAAPGIIAVFRYAQSLSAPRTDG